MAFTAGIKRPQMNTNSSNQNKQNNYDRLITVTGYDVSKGYLFGTDEITGKKYEVYITPSEVVRADAALETRGIDVNKINWMGHSINKGMEKHIPVGEKVVLIRSKVISNDKTREVSLTEAHRIGGVPNKDADKAFQGIFTMTYSLQEGKKRVSRLQHWNPRAVNINDSEGIEKLAESIDEARKNYGVKIGEHNVTEPTIGVQFRTLVKTDRLYSVPPLDNRPIYEVIDSSVPFDWMPGPEDENGKEIKTQAHPITGEEFMSIAQEYVEHAAEQFKDNIDNMRVEVAFFHAYPCSRNDELALTTGDKAKDAKADKNPLYQLTHRESYVDMAHTPDGHIVGRNAAVNGIVQIASNKVVKVDGKLVEIPNYWVTKIHANNTRGHVHSFIRSVDEEGVEYKAEPHEALKLVKTEEQKMAEQNRASSDDSHSETPSNAKPVQTSVATLADEKEFNPFDNDDDTPNFDEAVETPKASRLSFGNKK